MNQWIDRRISFKNPKVEILDFAISGRPVVKIESDFYIEILIDRFLIKIRVPVGFISDGASIPRFFHRLLPPGEHILEAIIHDYLYSIGCPKWFADYIMLHVMINLNRKKWKRNVIFLGVALFGGNAWNDCFVNSDPHGLTVLII